LEKRDVAGFLGLILANARVVAQKKYERCFSLARRTGGVAAGTPKDKLFVSTTFY
jgi:hypothetical protein